MAKVTRSTKGEIQPGPPEPRIQPVVRLVNDLKFPKRTSLGKPNHPK